MARKNGKVATSKKDVKNTRLTDSNPPTHLFVYYTLQKQQQLLIISQQKILTECASLCTCDCLTHGHRHHHNAVNPVRRLRTSRGCGGGGGTRVARDTNKWHYTCASSRTNCRFLKYHICTVLLFLLYTYFEVTQKCTKNLGVCVADCHFASMYLISD